jgi:hypothetical protein
MEGGAHSTRSLPIHQAKVGMSSAILLLFGIDGPFCSGHFDPFKKSFFLLRIWTVIITHPDVKT